LAPLASYLRWWIHGGIYASADAECARATPAARAAEEGRYPADADAEGRYPAEGRPRAAGANLAKNNVVPLRVRVRGRGRGSVG
jgi:hypothetical protein